MGVIDSHETLTKAKLADMAKEALGAKELELLDSKLTALDTAGSNYSGYIVFCDLKVKADGKVEDLSWAVKLPPLDSPERMPQHRDTMMEEKEIKFYREMLPKWKKMMKERNVSFTVNLHESPYAEFHKDWKKGSILALQNLKPLGFGNVENRTKGFNIHVAKLALEELAKIHALGYAYLKSYPGGTEAGVKENEILMKDYLFVDQTPLTERVMGSFMDNVVQSCVVLLKAVQEPGQDFDKGFLKLHEEVDVLRLRKKLFPPRKGDFNTFCHGDNHLNNILFKYETNKDGEKVPVAASWLDIALTHYGNPCADLGYFLFTSTTAQLRRTHLNEMLGHYHDTLVQCLSELGEDPSVYSYRQLLKDFDRFAVVSFFDSLWVVPPFYVSQEDQVGQEAMKGVDLEDKEQVKAMMENMYGKMQRSYEKVPEIKAIIAGNYLDLVDRGVIKTDC